MQGLLAYSAAQCSVFSELSRLRNGDCPRAGLSFQRSQFISTKQGKRSGCKAGVVYPIRYLRKPDWRCCDSASVEDGIATEEHTPLVTKETVTAAIEVAVPEGPTGPVKFVLQKKCQFGQSFNVVGNHPLFGSWNPEAALPMNWADGHLWTVEVDVPIGKSIEYKFVLTSEDGEITWQPGSNRFFKTVEDVSPLIVAGEWALEDEVELELPEEPDSLTEDAGPITTADLSNVASIVGLVENAKEEIRADVAGSVGLVEAEKEEIIAEMDSKLGEINDLPFSSDFRAVEPSETPQVLLANANLVSGTEQAASESSYTV